MERVGGFNGKADRLNSYYMATRNPDYFEEDLARYRAVTAADVKAAVERYLPKDRRVELSVRRTVRDELGHRRVDCHPTSSARGRAR